LLTVLLHMMCQMKAIIALLFVLIAVGYGADTTTVRIFQDSDTIAVAPIGSNSTCAASHYVLTNSTTDCISIVNSTSNFIANSLGCPTQLQGATSITCLTLVCYVLNPTTHSIVVLNPNGVVNGTISISLVANPAVFGAYLRNTTFAELLVADESGAVYQYTINYPWPITVRDPKIISITPVPSPIGISMYAAQAFMIAVLNEVTVRTFNLQTGVAGTFGTFGAVQGLSWDAYGNANVLDASCNCVQVINVTSGIIKSTIPLQTTTTFIANSRAKLLAVDSDGVVSYEKLGTVTYTGYSPMRCAGSTGYLFGAIDGGDYPYSIVSAPDFGYSVVTAPGNFSTGVSTAAPLIGHNVTLFDEYQHRTFVVVGTMPVANRFLVNSTTITPKSGELAYQFKFTSADYFSFTCQTPPACFQGTQYEYVSFWLNVGLGGQAFQIKLFELILYNILPGQLPSNKWVYFKFHFPTLTRQRILNGITAAQITIGLGYFNSIQITDTLKNPAAQNPFYIDLVTLGAYPDQMNIPNRLLYAFDACGAMTMLPATYAPEIFTVNVDSTPVSCNINTTSRIDLAVDGTLNATVSRGFAPYRYNWSSDFSTQNQSTLTGYPTMTSYITVYDNALNKSWVDISLADSYSLNETSITCHSPPACISWTPDTDGSALIFQVAPEIDITKYTGIEFWVNFGDYGFQTINAYVLRSIYYYGDVFSSGATVSNTLSIIDLHPWTWYKVNYVFANNPVTSNNKFNLVEFSNYFTPPLAGSVGNSSIGQPIVYIDDIVLVGASVVSVYDNTGCLAATNRARVQSPDPLTQAVTVTNAKCNAASDGAISVSMAGGIAPYTYTWSIAGADSSVANLNESLINVNVSDSNGCEFKPYIAAVLQPPPITINLTVTQPMCAGGQGVVSASVVGGSGSYTYSWVSSLGLLQTLPQPSPDAIFMDSLASPLIYLENAAIICSGTGSHLGLTVSPTHSGYCSLYLQFSATAPVVTFRGCTTCFSTKKYSAIMFWIYSDSDMHTLSLSFTQGSAQSDPFLFSTMNLQENAWNKVTINITDLELSAPDGFIINCTNPAAMNSVIIDDLVAVPYQYNSGGYAVLPGFVSVAQVEAAQYSLSVVDGNGCNAYFQVVVSEPSRLNMTYTPSSPSASDGQDGSIVVNVKGGTPPYRYSWTNGASTKDLSGVPSGPYSLTVTDANDCTQDLLAYVDPYIAPDVLVVRKYDATLSSGLAALVSVGLLICLFSATMLFKYWASFSILGSFLSSMILFGCVLSLLSALVLLPEPTDALCTSFIWLLGIGFVLVYGCLFIKTWALYKVWRNAIHYHKASLTPGYIVRCLGMAVLVEAVFLAIWTAIDRPKVHLVKVVNHQAERQCDTDNVTFWVIFLAGKGAWLIFGAVLSVLTKNIAKEYNESSSIAYAIYNNVLLGVIAIPLAILIKEVPGARLTVEVVIVCLAFSFTMVVVFFRIWHSIILPDKVSIGTPTEMRKRQTASSGSMKSSKSGSSKGSPSVSGTTDPNAASASADSTI
jgi:hypothetical protein